MPDYTRKQLDVNGSYIFPYTHADSVLYTTVNAFNGITSGTDTNVKAVLDALDNTYRRQDSNITSLYNSQGKRGFLYQNGTTTTASMELPTQDNDFYVPTLKYDSNGNIITAWQTPASIAAMTDLSGYLPLTGGTLTGLLTIDSNTMGAVPHIQFNRANFNYLNVPTNGTLAISINGAGGVNTYLAVSSTAVYPGYHDKTIDLGTSTYPWQYLYTKSIRFTGIELAVTSSGSRLAVGTYSQAQASGFNVGNLLVSNAWGDYTNVPTNGIYVKGNIRTAGNIQVGTGGTNSYLASDSATNIYLHNSQGAILVCDGLAVRRGTTLTNATLGTSAYPWLALYATTVYENGTSLASKYLALSGGTMTGALNVSTSNSAIDTTKGINFTQGSTTGHIGLSTLLGIYSSNDIAIRPGGGNTAGQGLDITANSFKFNNTNVSLEGHTHDDRYVTDVGLTDDVANHPNQLVSIKNGVKSYFTVPYATEASKLKVLQTKTYEGILRVNATYSSPYVASYLYFGSVKTTDLTKPSHVKYKVLAYAPSNANFQLESVVEWYFGNNGIYKGSYIWNNLSSTSYYPFGYHTLYYAKTAAIAQSDGSYLGCYYGSSASYGQSANTVARTIKIEVTECNNCTVDLLDDPVWLNNASSVPANFRQPSTSKAYNDANFTATNVSTAVGLQETGDANTNTIGYQLRTNSYSKPMTSAMGYGYRLLFTSADKLGWVPANNSASSNATAVRTPATDLIDPFGEIVYYSGTAAVAAGSRPGATSLWQQYTITLGYSFNTTGAALMLTSWEPVYIKCRPEPDDSAEIIGYTQDLPTSEDGFIYIYLGVAYSATAIELIMNHPVYYYKDGAIRPWLGGTDSHDYSKDYLTTKALGDGEIGLSSLYPMQYSLDNGNTWITPDYTDGSYVDITVSKGTSIKWKGEVPEETTITQGIGHFYSDVEFEVCGNLNSLLYGDDFQNEHVLPNAFGGYISYQSEVLNSSNADVYDTTDFDPYADSWETLSQAVVYGLFSQSKVVNAENLVLDTLLAAECYAGLFSECNLLEKAPKFSPTTVAEFSCLCMFQGCSSLTTFESDLSAEILEDSCYAQMFKNCISLTRIPKIQATVLADYCCQAMFKGCAALKEVKEFPQATLAGNCFEAMFMNSGVEKVAVLPYQVLQPYCFKNMFRGCKNLEQYGGLLASTFATSSCESMFRECNNLGMAAVGGSYEDWENYGGEEDYSSIEYTLGVNCFKSMFADCYNVPWIVAPLLAYATPVEGCYQYMFKNCKEIYEFPSLTISTTAKRCCYGMFEGCGAGSFYSNYTLPITLSATELTEYCYARMFKGTTFVRYHLPVLPATTLAKGCYAEMFKNCEHLTEPIALPATTLAERCYESMFEGCISLQAAPTLNATTLQLYCYSYMFSKCISLSTAPSLPATSLAGYCYEGMFSGCTYLTQAPTLSATTLVYSCYAYMFENCRSLVTAPSLPALSMQNSCYSHMFAGCTSLKNAPTLPATTLAYYCYSAMFQGCTSLIEAPEILATTYEQSCFSNMFRNCTALTTVSNIQTIDARYDSHDYMFYGCSSLNFIHNQLKTVTNTATHSDTNSPLTEWLTGVAETGIYVKPDSGVTWTGIGIPAGWTVLTETEYAQYQQQHKNDGKPVFIVEVTATGSTTYTADKTSEQVYNAFQDGYPIELRYSSSGIDSVAYVYEVNYDSNNDIYTIYYISILPSMGLDSHHEFEFQHQGTTVTGYYKQLVTTTQVTSYIESAVGTSIVNHGTSDTSFSLTPNVFHKWGSVVSLNLSLATPSNTDIVNEYMFEFTSPSTPTNLTLPNTVRWIAIPSIEANKTYQVSIINDLAVIGGA